jgi:hypothetical protein
LTEPDVVADPEALTGAMIAGGFGIAWVLWGASGLSGGPAVDVRVVGLVLGLAIVLGGALLQARARRAGTTRPDAPGSLFASRSYRLVVLGEVIALVGGGLLLGSTGHSEYAVAWYAFVVGVHFVLFGRLFWAGFYWLGAALIAAAVAGAIVGFTGGGPDAIRAVSALIAAASLFAAGGWTVLAARAGLRG